jgi:membrane-associated protease RseP (regulator of RpoE activity)
MYFDPRTGHGPMAPWQKGFCAGLLAVVIGWLLYETCRDFEPVKLVPLLLILFWMPLMVLHEAGHAVTARLLGWYVGKIVLGMGPELCRFRLGAADVEVRLVPVEGFVQCVPTNLRLPHLKSALIYFAGPGVELLLALAILIGVGPDRLLSESADFRMIVVQCLALAAASQAVLNLIPHGVFNPQGFVANDGLGIVLSFVQPTAYYAAMLGQAEWDERPS